MSEALKISWIIETNNPNSASFRIRVLTVMAALRKRGYSCELYDEANVPDVLILSKTYTDRALLAAKVYKERKQDGVVLFDICDNHFQSDIESDFVRQRVMENRLKITRVLGVADGVIVSSEFLRSLVVRVFEVPERRVYFIDDCIDNLQDISFGAKTTDIFAEIMFLVFRHQLGRADRSKRFIWYGAHGVDYAEAGMSELNRRAALLNQALAGVRGGSSLTIVSNSYRKYLDFKNKVDFPVYYLPWHHRTFDRVLKLHTCLLLPITLNNFTAAKSSNRIVTALNAGLEVVCDLIPAYEGLSNFLYSPLSLASISDYFEDADMEAGRAEQEAADYVQSTYSGEEISRSWAEAIGAFLDA